MKPQNIATKPAGRGQVTPSLRQKLAELYEIKPEEVVKEHLRFLPYLQFELINSKNVSRSKASRFEISLLDFFIEKGYLWYLEDDKFYCTREFYAKISDIIFESYSNQIYFEAE